MVLWIYTKGEKSGFGGGGFNPKPGIENRCGIVLTL